jgi:hypothetical protein
MHLNLRASGVAAVEVEGAVAPNQVQRCPNQQHRTPAVGVPQHPDPPLDLVLVRVHLEQRDPRVTTGPPPIA